jgi:HEPN domain-containing protein
MNKDKIRNLEKQVNYFVLSSDRSWNTAKYLLKGGKYGDCLLFCHLTLEKLLKGLITETTKDFAPYIHDLVKLAYAAKLKLTSKQIQDLREISGFNMLARYDDERDTFYKKTTKEFTEEKFKLCKKYKKCIQEKYPTKYKVK